MLVILARPVMGRGSKLPYSWIENRDHEVDRMSQQDSRKACRRCSNASSGHLQQPLNSRFQPDPICLDILCEKATGRIKKTTTHAKIEHVVQTCFPSFMNPLRTNVPSSRPYCLRSSTSSRSRAVIAWCAFGSFLKSLTASFTSLSAVTGSKRNSSRAKWSSAHTTA